MKKKKITLISLFLLSFLFIQNVSAASYKVWRPEETTRIYSLKTSTTNLPVYLNLYKSSVDGVIADTYCVDPGKSYAGDSSFILDRYIDPSNNNPLDLAIAGGLKEINNLRSTGIGGDDLQLIGIVAMRWIFMQYGGSKLSSASGPELTRDYNAFRNSDTAISVNGNVAIVQYARQVFVAGINAANTGSYDQAVSQGYVYSPDLKAVNYTLKSVVGNKRTITFEIQPGDATKTPSQLYIDSFQAGCTNTSVTCTVNTKSAKYEPAGLLIEMTIDTTNWNNQDFGIYVDPAYCDKNDAGMQILLLRKSSNAYQRMLAVLPGNCPATPTRRPPRRRIPVESNNCECNYTNGTTWDGTYTVTEKTNGSTNKFTIKETEKDKVNQYSCPSPDTCRKRENFTCQKPSESKDGKYHCPSSSNPDGSCSEKEYKEQCTHNCDPDGESDEPDEAKHNSTNTFYCKESSPGAGDGKVCSEAEHNAQCHKNYVDCSPVVSLPGTCSNISDGSKIEGTTTGVISDINEGDASCSSKSSKPNQIKKCVLGKTDSTSASYEATNEISGNSYCKVYCKEKYNFVLPTAKMTTSGGYFKLNTTVTGTRDCYVASASNSQLPIDETKFNNDLVAAQHSLIDAWNEYNHWKVAASISSKAEQTHDVHSAHSYDCNCSTTCGPTGCSESCSTCHCDGVERSTTIYSKEWSYTVYDYNGNTSTRSDSYTSGTKAECQHNSCTGENGTNKDSEHKSNRDSALRTLKQKAKELNDIIAMYNSCTGVIGNTNYASSLTDATTSSTAQSTWNNDMQFNPVVEFWYNQDYLQNVNDLSSGWAKFTNLTDESDTSKNTYCTGDINDSYECTTGTSSKEPTKSVQALTCAENNCSWKSYNVSSAKWITKSKTKSGTYQTSQNFSTYTPYGTIKTDSNGNKYLYTTLPEGSWPISLVTKTGVFPFKFRFSDIGQSNSSTDLGRLSDSNESGKNTVVHAYNNLPSGLKCGGESNAYTDGGYVCNYLNNCTDNCDFSCDPNDPTHCTFNTCDNGKCVVTCTNCIFDGNKTTYGYRTVSLNNLFPNGISGRGYNWSGEGISNQKSSDTKKEIEEAGDSIYETPQYSYTLTPSNMKNIRDYNDDAGSFTNSTVPSKYSVKSNINDSSVYCESVSYNGITYNVNCKSSFLDLIETTGKKFATQNERITTDNDAFVLYTSTNSCLEGSCLKNGIGPSWKLKGSSKQ